MCQTVICKKEEYLLTNKEASSILRRMQQQFNIFASFVPTLSFQLLKYYLALEYYKSFGPHFKKALFNIQYQKSSAVLVNVNQLLSLKAITVNQDFAKHFAKLLIKNNMCLSFETVFVLFLEKEISYREEKVSFSLTKRRQINHFRCHFRLSYNHLLTTRIK